MTGKKPRKRSNAKEIAIVGELFEEGEKDIVEALLDVPIGAEVTIYIDCAGGSIYAALTIAALIRYRRLQATAVVLAECSSSALLVFAACQRRLVTPRSVFLFHRAKWRSERDYRTEEAASWAQHFQWLEEEADRYQAELLGVKPDRLIEWCNASRHVLGPEIVANGLAELLDV